MLNALFPRAQRIGNAPLHPLPGLEPLDAANKQIIVIGFGVPQMGDDGQANCVVGQFFRGSGATDPTAVLKASPLGNGSRSMPRPSATLP